MVTNEINRGQYAYLQSPEGQAILPCWVESQDLRPENGHIQPNSGPCMGARYVAEIQPQIATNDPKEMVGDETSPLPKACRICPIMAQTLALMQTITLQ